MLTRRPRASPAASASHWPSSSISFLLLPLLSGAAARVGAARSPQAYPMLPGSSSPHPRVSCRRSSPLLALCSVHSAQPCSLCPSCVTRSSSLGESGRWAVLLRSREMVQFSYPGANRTEDGTILGFLALPCSAAGVSGGIFCWFVFILCCVSSQPGQALPLPLRLPAACLPSRGPGSTLFKPRVFCLWVCILVALSDFCFIISSNRLWCQKH